MIDVVIADHQELFRIGVAEVLAVADDIRIVAQPESPEQLLHSAGKYHTSRVDSRRLAFCQCFRRSSRS